ncbi:MAG TPA: triose-phosphate isomerase [Bdellovibrionales bacterium]|nr:triose-phosphate isomerase [Bdellovibrionales bacterium]
MRPFLAAANWKMNKTPEEAVAFFREFKPLVTNSNHRQVAIFPPMLLLTTVREQLNDGSFLWGAQNCHFEKQGAFTGETSPAVLARLGAHFALVGHSERRTLFGENDELCAKKVKAIQAEGMTPMLCVGETLAQRESGTTADVIKSQLAKGLAQADLDGPLVIAYEPVWAIGTGKVATPDQAEEAHRILRAQLNDLGGARLGSRVQILYGGSVTAQNARELSMLPNVDGFLVGGASLNPQSFAAIANVK